MGDVVFLYSLVDFICSGFSQTDMGSPYRRQAPGETPSVAVKQRKRPQVDRFFSDQVSINYLTYGIQISSAVMINNALGISCCSRGVIKRNRIPFILWIAYRNILRSLFNKFLVFNSSDRAS